MMGEILAVVCGPRGRARRLRIPTGPAPAPAKRRGNPRREGRGGREGGALAAPPPLLIPCGACGQHRGDLAVVWPGREVWRGICRPCWTQGWRPPAGVEGRRR